MSMPRLSRLSAILTILQSKRIVTATELSKKFEVSVRTIYRDMRSLEESGIPLFTEEGKGYSLIEGYSLPPVMFSEVEANALVTVEKLIQGNTDQSLVENYSEAITKIKAVLKHHSKDKVDLLSQRTHLFKKKTEEKSDYLSAIQLAITNFNVLKIDYHSLSKDEKSTRVIEPMAVYSTRERWIVVGWCRKRKAYREFRLDRMLKFISLDEHFLAHDFDLKKYFMGNIRQS